MHNGKRGRLGREESNIMLDLWKKFNPAELLLCINQNYVIIVNFIIVMCVFNIVIYNILVKNNAKQKQPGCKKSVRPIRSHNGYKRPKTLISSKAKKLNILLRILLLE